MSSLLYRFGGQPYVYPSEWNGMPQRSSRVPHGMGEANFYESSAPAHKRYRPLVKARSQHYRRTIRDLSGPPLRESGPEPLDPGEMPSWQKAYREDPVAQPVGDEGEITMEPMYVGPAAPSIAAAPFLGLSTNEKRLALVVGIGAVGLFLLKRRK